MTLVFQILLYCAVFYAGCVLFMYLRQESFLFFPTTARHEQTETGTAVDYHLQRGAIDLRGWLTNPRFARDTLLLYYGGNAEDVYYNIDEYQDIQAATLFVAYRGYGPSSGKPGEAEFFDDALAVFDDVVKRYQPKAIYLVGRSLGTGIACHVAARRPVRGAVLITPYDSIRNVAATHYPWLPTGRLLKHPFVSLDALPAIRCPLLVIYGGRDTVIPPRHTENLIAHIQGEKEVVFIPQAEHGTITMYPEFWRSILQFLNRDR